MTATFIYPVCIRVSVVFVPGDSGLIA